MPALRFSKSDATIATPSSPANSLRAEVDLPGISSANSKFLWSSVWQKYCDRKSSGRQTIAAPFLAASRMNSIAREKFFSGSTPQRICTSATFVVSAIQQLTTEHTEITEDQKISVSVCSVTSVVKNHFTESGAMMSIFSITTRV